MKIRTRATLAPLRLMLSALVAAALLVGCGSAATDPEPEPSPEPEPTPRGPLALETVVEDALFPVAMAFLPSGEMLYTEKDTDRVRVLDRDRQLLDEPFVDLSEAEANLRGGLGIAVDPDFESNATVYLAVTANQMATSADLPRDDVARVLRMRAEGLRAQPDSVETLIVVGQGQTAVGYEAGNLHFGPDGHLYLSVGDRRPDAAPQDPEHSVGRMMRYTREGDVPADNPFGSSNPTFALGLRNTFDFDFAPGSGRLYATDNGPVEDDEINLVEAGMNYGWPGISGLVDTAAETAVAEGLQDYREPLTETGAAPTGIVVDQAGYFDEPGSLIVVEWATGALMRWTLSEDGRGVSESERLAEDLGLPVGVTGLTWGPDGWLYLCSGSAIHRLGYLPAE